MFSGLKLFAHLGDLFEVEDQVSGGTPADGILDEDGTTFLVAEDGTTFIVHE
jgi:hypothetical protein